MRSKERPARAAHARRQPSPSPTSVPALGDPSLFLNRELSLLAFQRRVLEEALDESNPLLERVKFLAIVGSNMDEFFMVRVAGLKQQVAAGVLELSPDGLAPAEQLVVVRREATAVLAEAHLCWQERLRPALKEAGILIHDYKGLGKRQKANLRRYFDQVVFPVLTPLALDPGRPFPHVSNLSLNLAILVKGADGEQRFARLKVPDMLPRLVPIKPVSGKVRRDDATHKRQHFVWLEQVIAANLGVLFPGMKVVETHPFRVIRNADLDIQELDAGDLLETIEEGVRRRRFGTVVQLVVSSSMPKTLREILIDNLEVDRRDVARVEGPMGLSALMGLTSIPWRALKDKPFVPAVSSMLDRRSPDFDIFSIIRDGDVLLHHPFDSFEPVVDFLFAAARDPDVLAIKMTLYRIGRNSPVVQALLEANERHKQVAVLVELKARFDEEPNIEWAKALESRGVHVVYGLLGLKTHSKTTLVVRREGKAIRRYCHLATGNYNVLTAQLYTDLGLFTCEEAIGADVTDLFNYLTGYSAKTAYRKLLVAPINMRERLDALIAREIEHQRRKRGGHIIFKINALVDPPIIRKLYEASQAGVRVDLLVRGMCSLRPGLAGISENITVTSIVGRFLEHSRIYWFANGGEEEVYLGSADLMPRNINRRVEVLFPVESDTLVRHIRDVVLATYLADNVKARKMRPDGSYFRRQPKARETAVDAQARLIAVRGSETT
jgi:polyphosphate kinase